MSVVTLALKCSCQYYCQCHASLHANLMGEDQSRYHEISGTSDTAEFFEINSFSLGTFEFHMLFNEHDG